MRPKKTAQLSAIIVSLLGLAHSISAVKIFEPHEIIPGGWCLYSSLYDQFLRVEHALRHKLPNNDRPLDNLNSAKQMLARISGWHSIREHSLKTVLNLFVSLEQTDSCDLNGYETLLKNRIASQKCDDYHELAHEGHLDRVSHTIEGYRLRRARKCRPYFKEKFHQLLDEFDHQTLNRLQFILGTLKFEDLTSLPGTKLEFVTHYKLNFNERSLYIIASRIATSMEVHQAWNSIRPYFDERRFDVIYPKIPSEVVYDYLFKPCEKYNNHFANVLALARLEAVIEDEYQLRYLTDDGSFTDGLVYHRLCEALLEDSKSFAQSLNHYLDYLRRDDLIN